MRALLPSPVDARTIPSADECPLTLAECAKRRSRFRLRQHGNHLGPVGVAGKPKVPSTTSTKVLSSRRMSCLLCAIAKFAALPDPTSGAFGRPRTTQGYRMQSNPKPHHSCLRVEENSRPVDHRIEE